MDELGVSSTLKGLTIEILNILESSNLEHIQSEIKNREEKASTLGLSEEELRIYYAHLAVAKYSAAFWSPASMGGENGFKYLNGAENARIVEINWWKVAGCDIIGGFVGGCKGYIGASAISAIMQL